MAQNQNSGCQPQSQQRLPFASAFLLDSSSLRRTPPSLPSLSTPGHHPFISAFLHSSPSFADKTVNKLHPRHGTQPRPCMLVPNNPLCLLLTANMPQLPLRNRPAQRKVDENATSRHLRQTSGIAVAHASRFAHSVVNGFKSGAARPALGEVTTAAVNRKVRHPLRDHPWKGFDTHFRRIRQN